MLFPKGILLRISTAGFYLPFTGESNIDAGLHPIQLPFVMAHEYAHGYGTTDEGSCNFLGFLACENAADPFIRYSGHYGYWRYLLSSFRLQNPEAYKTFREALPAGIKADIKAISENSDKYPDIFPKFRDLTYDAFLKAQGINDGMANYNRIVFHILP